MSNNFKITCFTDLQGSTALTEKLGHDRFRKLREEYLNVGKIICANLGGKYIKNVGDSHMVTFDDPIKALQFATHLQQYYMHQANFSPAELNSRIGLYLGIVEETDQDVFGSGVNQGARVESLCRPGEIWVHEEFVKVVSKIWGKSNSDIYFISEGRFELKGISNPPDQELFSFDWKVNVAKYPKFGLAQVVLNHLENASIVVSNLNLNDISRAETIIWPVVPRDNVNAIHRGQLEIIRLLTILGWSVHVLIADCGITKNFTKEYASKFKDSIEMYAGKRGMKNFQYSFMSDLYTPKCNKCDILHKYFQKVISSLTLQNLLDFNHKGYSEDVKDFVKKAMTLDFLHPVLTIASIMYMCDQKNSKCIVVVGYDEHIQWVGVHSSIPETCEKYGVLFNPIINKKEGAQARQTRNWPIFFSTDGVVSAMEDFDMKEWLVKLHLFIPNFPSNFVKIGTKTITPEDWLPNKRLADDIDKYIIAKEVYEKIFNI